MELPPLKRTNSRGLKQLIHRIDILPDAIEQRFRRGSKTSILEVGAGHGVALIELGLRYGDRVELHGVNLSEMTGNRATMQKAATKRGYGTGDNADPVNFPHLHYFDVCQPWPLADHSFDVVYSQHAFLWFEDKIKVLEEINRVLKDDGVALMDLQLKRHGSPQKHSVIIMKDGERVPFWEYARSFECLKVHGDDHELLDRAKRRIKRWLGMKGSSKRRRTYTAMTKQEGLDFGLEFSHARRFSEDTTGRQGCQSVYRKRGRVDEELEPACEERLAGALSE